VRPGAGTEFDRYRETYEAAVEDAIGFAVSASSFVFGLVTVFLRVSGVGIVPGWASLVVLISFLGGVQLIVLGMMGLYVARIHEEVKARPLYLVRESRGYGAGEAPAGAPASLEVGRPL
jgi:polyisoprenyl-phosphate glycosyltransferase